MQFANLTSLFNLIIGALHTWLDLLVLVVRVYDIEKIQELVDIYIEKWQKGKRRGKKSKLGALPYVDENPVITRMV